MSGQRSFKPPVALLRSESSGRAGRLDFARAGKSYWDVAEFDPLCDDRDGQLRMAGRLSHPTSDRSRSPR